MWCPADTCHTGWYSEDTAAISLTARPAHAELAIRLLQHICRGTRHHVHAWCLWARCLPLSPANAGLVSESTQSHAGAPDIDIVFVHGIRGGPFVTWRRVRTPKTLDPSTGNIQMSVPDMRHELCWPTVWLKGDVPGARLLSLEYAAPASGWEVHLSLPSDIL